MAQLALADKRVLVLGLGLSGRSAARFCAERGARVTAVDERGEAEIGAEALTALRESLGSRRIELRTGGPFPSRSDYDLVVPSPGIPEARYREGARQVWGDVELAYRALSVPVVAVTGTNGKSTVVRLLEAMLRAAGLRAMAAGNVGTPALELVGAPLDVAVLEVSSFQLEAVDALAPKVAVVLNLTPDHLDRHGDLEGYANAKAKLLARQTAADFAVLNADDPYVRRFAERTEARLAFFSASSAGPPPTESAEIAARVEITGWLEGEGLVLRDRSGLQRVPLSGLALTGRHNLENVLAASVAIAALGADVSRAAQALAGFRGLPHRCEVVSRRDDRLWVDDSKATNPGAAARSLAGFEGPIVWIAGGRDKGLDYDELAKAAQGRVRCALLIGEAAGKLEDSLVGEILCEQCGDLARAVERAAEISERGDVVLLAPACSSFDQFANFEARGEAFARAVEALSAREDA